MAKTDPIFEAAARVAKQRAQTELDATRTQLSILDSITQIQSAGEEEIEAVGSFEDASTTIVAEKDAMAARVDAANARAKLDLGTDSEKGNYRLSKLAGDRESSYEAAVKAEQIIFDKKQTTFASDPLGWIHAQITMPGDVDVYNHYATRHNMAEDEYNSIVQSTTLTAQANNATKTTVSAALADANLQVVAAQADKERAGIQAKYSQFNISGAQALQGLSQQQLTNAHSALSEQEALGNFQMRQANMAAAHASRQEANARRALLDDQRIALGEEKAAIRADQETTAGYYNEAVRKLGGVELPTPQVLALLRTDKTGHVGNLMRYGQEVQDAKNAGVGSDGIPVLGAGMSAADLPSILRTARARPTALDSGVYGFAAEKVDEIVRTQGAALGKDPAERSAKIAEFVKIEAVKQLTAIDTSKDSSNIYAAPTPKQLTESVPLMAKYPALAEVIKRSVDNPDVPIKDADIIASAKLEVRKNPSKQNLEVVAKSLEAYYTAATTYNNVHKQYLEKGLPQQTTYNASIPTGAFGRNQTINLRDPIQIKRLLLEEIAGPVGTNSPFGFN